jgi:hypothetical protein
MHGSTSRAAVAAYLQRNPTAEPAVRAGIEAFMACYGVFFRALTMRLHLPAQA